MHFKIFCSVVCLAGLLCLAQAAEDCKGRNAATAKCTAYAALSITATDGKCSGSAGADCKVWTQSESVYQEEIATWLASPKADLCSGVGVNATAEAVATAIAAVWANTFVNLDCTGGFACGWTLGNAEGMAVSVAESVALAVADAAEAGKINGKTAEAFCYADVRGIGASLAEAFADAQSDTCAQNGNSTVMQNSYAFSAQTTVARALASATVSICETIEAPGKEDLAASSLCTGEADVARQEKRVAFGDACARVTKINLCKGFASRVCCKTGKAVCTFTKKQKRKCKPKKDCRKSWIRMKADAGDLVYRQANKKNCLCDPQQ